MEQRKSKVTSESRRNQHKMYSHSVAGVRLSGRWLERAGFLIGNTLSIIVTSNYIQIVKDTTPQKGGSNE